MTTVSAAKASSDEIEQFKRVVYDFLDVVRVYTKAPGKKADFDSPYVVDRGSTVLDVAEKVHRDFVDNLEIRPDLGRRKNGRDHGSARFRDQRGRRPGVAYMRNLIKVAFLSSVITAAMVYVILEWRPLRSESFAAARDQSGRAVDSQRHHGGAEQSDGRREEQHRNLSAVQQRSREHHDDDAHLRFLPAACSDGVGNRIWRGHRRRRPHRDELPCCPRRGTNGSHASRQNQVRSRAHRRAIPTRTWPSFESRCRKAG